MSVEEQINEYIEGMLESKRSDILALHHNILQQMAGCKLWFLDGKNDQNKIVTNPNIGYGSLTIHYADGKEREFYRIGLSANKTGISVYVMGLEDKQFLFNRIANRIGKASVTGYCIKFKALKNIDTDVLNEVIRYTAEQV